MNEKILYLFPDTNLFVQCKPLQELNWSEWSDFTEVHLIVCRPVTREIDNQKKPRKHPSRPESTLYLPPLRASSRG